MRMVPIEAGAEEGPRLCGVLRTTVGAWMVSGGTGNREGLKEMCTHLRDGRDPGKILPSQALTPASQEATHCLSAQ